MTHPVRECDVVMKGGITSGVVYPLAIYELANVYRFRNIGGTSAGAIAAVLTAAAEYRRRTRAGEDDQDAGFEELRKLPGWLQTDRHLLRLFQPQDSTQPLFLFLMAFLTSTKKTMLGKVSSAIMRSEYRWCAFIVAALIAGIIAALVSTGGNWIAIAIASGGLFLFGVTLFFALPAAIAASHLLKRVPPNFYGLCSGMPPASEQDAAPLTPWLADQIDFVAGKTGAPLTFGDLWGADPDDRAVNIEMFTTNVTYGRPFTLPMEHAINSFYFGDAELRGLFPERIVTWMRDHPRPATRNESQERRATLQTRGLYPLPAPADIPIVLAARMSLSFPLLLSAVPLHGIDWDLQYNLEHPQAPYTHRCWFSDGGLSSNFPLQFFDAPIPSRPTFGINLRPFDDLHPEDPLDESKNVWMQSNNHDRINDARNYFDAKGGNVGGFLASIVDTMQNWNDNLQAQVPGFEDRIVHVFLDPKEGGLNLDMPAEVLDKLTKRGSFAGRTLIEHFTEPSPSRGPQPTNWENHRWVRFRTATSVLQRFIGDFGRTYAATPENGDTPYGTMVSRSKNQAPFSYEMTLAQSAFARAEADTAAAMGSRWTGAAPNDFETGSPLPTPELQIRPRI